MKQLRTETHKQQVEREVAFIQRAAKELNMSVNDLCGLAGLKQGLVSQWLSRLKHGQITRIRASTLLAIHNKVAELRREKRANGAAEKAVVEVKVEPKAPPAMVCLTEDDLPKDFTNTTPAAKVTSGHQALAGIIREKLNGMSLVQLALLLAHIEGGNGK